MPAGNRQMYSAVDDISKFNDLAIRLERLEAYRENINLKGAREKIAPKLGITYSTLENYRTTRIKRVPHWLMQRVKDELIAILNSEMDRLGNEIHLAKNTANNHCDDALAEAEASLAKARQLLHGN
jgi:hypothetical protein